MSSKTGKRQGGKGGRNAAPSIRNRNLGVRRVRACDLVAHPLNWRQHQQAQQDALRGVLNEVGFVGTLLAYELPDGRLGLIDGHLRTETLPNEEVDVMVVDLSPEEAAKVLATHDPLAAMAKTNAEALDKLIQQTQSESDALCEMLSSLANQNIIAETSPEDASKKLEGQSETLEQFIAMRKKSIERGDDKAEKNFWVCLVFQSWMQKQEFLFAIKDIPVLYGMYADGQTLAGKVGIDITPNTQKPHKTCLDKKLADLVSEDQKVIRDS